jgi:proteasome accessory factor A
MLIAWLGHALLLVALIAYLLLAGILYLLLLPFLKAEWRGPVQAALLGDELSGRVAYSSPVPEWVEAAALGYIRVVAGPLALGLYFLVRWTCFHSIRRDLTSFLISRPIIGGAGFVDKTGNFQLSDKSWGMNCQLGYNGIVFDRPIYSIGHFFKSLMFRVWSSPREFTRLLAPRQRLQICLGDSNMAEEAEYLRVGTTMLVLDAIEAGYIEQLPKVNRPIKSLHAICADPELKTAVRCKDGKSRTAVEIQRLYLEACQSFVAESPDATNEARDILERWDEALTLLETNPDALVGRLDWVTKRFLLRQTVEEGDDEAVKKKIDIRYHELSPDGYYRRLESTGVTRTILFPEEIEQATKNPPKATPATIRSRFIRELAHQNQALRVNWDTLIIGRGFSAKRIVIADLPTDGPMPGLHVFVPPEPPELDEKDSR